MGCALTVTYPTIERPFTAAPYQGITRLLDYAGCPCQVLGLLYVPHPQLASASPAHLCLSTTPPPCGAVEGADN